MMALLEGIRSRAQLLLFAFCQMRVPASIRSEYRLAFRVRQNTITLYECVGPWQPRFPKAGRRAVAQLRYDGENGVWSRHWADTHEHWHLYVDAPPTPDLVELIAEVHVDRKRVFFA